jgi:TP901 family phage tail tape measure protein
MPSEDTILRTILQVSGAREHDSALMNSDRIVANWGQGLNKSSIAASAFGNIIGRTVTGAVHSLASGLGSLIDKTLETGKSYEVAMNTFQAVTRASSDQMERAAAIAQQLGADMELPATSAGDAALAMVELAKGGLSVGESMDAARGSLQLAAAAQIGEAEAAKITATSLNAFNLEAKESTRVSDLLAAASNASAVEITDIALSMQQSAASAHSLKVPIEDLTTSISLMGNAGIRGSDAGTSLKVMFDRLTPETKKATAAMKDLGIDAFDAQGRFIGLEAVIRQAQPALARMTDQQKQFAIGAAFGSDAQRAANIILGQGAEKFHEMREAVTRQGAAAELSAAKTKGLSGAMDGLASVVETKLLDAFKGFAPETEGIVRGLAEVISGDWGKGLDRMLGKTDETFTNMQKSVKEGMQGVNRQVVTESQVIAKSTEEAAKLIASKASVSLREGIMITGGGTTLMKEVVGIWIADLHLAPIGFAESIPMFEKTGRDLREGLKKGFTAPADYLIPIVNSWLYGPAWDRQAKLAADQGRRLSNAFFSGFNQADPSGKRLAAAFGYNTQQGFQMGVAAPLAGEFGRLFGSQPVAGAVDKAAKDGAAGGGRIAGGIGGGIKKGKGEVDKALKETVDSVNDWARASDLAVTFTAESWKRQSPAIRRELESLGIAYRINQKELERLIIETYPELARMNFEVQKSFARIAQDSLKPLNVEVAKNGATWRGWDEDVRGTINTTKQMEAALAKVPDQMRAIGSETLRANKELTSFTDIQLETARITLETHRLMVAMTQEATRLAGAVNYSGGQMEGFNKVLEKGGPITDKLTEAQKKLKDEIEEISRRIPDSVNKILAAWGKLDKGTASTFADIFDIIGLLPGKVGSALQRAVNEFDRWFNLLDKVIRVVERVFGEKNPEGIVGIIQRGTSLIIKNFEKTAASVSSWQEAFDSAEGQMGSVGSTAETEIGGKFSKAFGVATAAISGFVTGLSIAQATGSKALGAISGAAMGALQGFMAGGPIGAIIGGIGGLLGGLFGGKSELQKAQEAAALQQARDAVKISQQAVIKAVEESKQSMLTTTAQVRDIIESIRFHTSIGKEPMKAFFADLHLFWKLFAREADNFKELADEEIKKASKTMKVAADGLSQMPLIFEGINQHFGVSEVAMDLYFRDFGRLTVKLGVLAEETPNSLEKQIKKFSTRLKPSAELLNDTTAGLKEMFDLKPVPDEKLDLWAHSIERIVFKIGVIADDFDKGHLKTIEFFSTKTGAAVSLWREGSEALKAIADVPVISEANFDNVVSGMRAGLKSMITLSVEFAGEGLTRAAAIANSSLAVSSALKSWAETSGVMRDYTQIAEQSWHDIVADFERGLDLLHLLMSSAIEYEAMAIEFETRILSGSSHLEAGLKGYGSSILNAASILNSTVGSLQGGVTQEVSFAGSNVTFAPQVLASPQPFIPQSAVSSGQTVINNYDNRLVVNEQTFNSDDPRVAEIIRLFQEIINSTRR